MGRKRKQDINDVYNQTEYNVVDEIRYVVPYIHEYSTYAKGRWLNKKILDVLMKEFGGHSIGYWRNAIDMGHVRVNNNIVKTDYIFKNSDEMLHRTHRHEPPVMGDVTLVGETEKLLAVCKPPTMPMHPCGAYRFNSLMFILAKNPLSTDQATLHLVHRLDRVTSGLVVLAKSKEVAGVVSKEIREKTTKKIYLARVRGSFPSPAGLEELPVQSMKSILDFGEDIEDDEDGGDRDLDFPPIVTSTSCSKQQNKKRRTSGHTTDTSQTITVPTSSSTVGDSTVKGERDRDKGERDRVKGVIYGHCVTETGDLIVRYPLDVVSYKDGIYACNLKGKTSVTTFRCLGYRALDDTSLVECRPLTGRTHQIRLHLQLLGNPIANDPCYGGQLFYGQEDKRKLAVETLQIMRVKGYHPLSKVPHNLNDVDPETAVVTVTGDGDDTAVTSSAVHAEDGGHVASRLELDTRQPTEVPSREERETDDQYLIRTCRYCQEPEGLLLERVLHCEGIWLHALRYEGNGWAFETPRPVWGENNLFYS